MDYFKLMNYLDEELERLKTMLGWESKGNADFAVMYGMNMKILYVEHLKSYITNNFEDFTLDT